MDRPVLLSYRHVEQKAFVELFDQECQSRLITTWRDDRVRKGQIPEEAFEAMLPRAEIVLVFISNQAVEGLRDQSSGLHREVTRLLHRRPGEKFHLVLVDLVGYSTGQIANMPLIGAMALSLRLVVKQAFDAFKANDDAGARDALNPVLDELVEELSGVDAFPREHATLDPSAYLLSSATHNGADRVNRLDRSVSQEAGALRPLLPLRQYSGQRLLELSFQHYDGADDWWAAVVGLDSDLADEALGGARTREPKGEWRPRDLSKVRFLELDMRADAGGRPVPIQVRLEDDSLGARAGSSFHQSTSWNLRALLVGAAFKRLRLSLDDDFRWTATAFPFNTAPPDRRRIVQITFGHDAATAPVRGCIEIRRITFR